MCVNISSRLFGDSELVDELKMTLATTGMEASKLKLEITESALINDMAAARATLGDAQAMGIEWSLDDFGTGYSSLSHLHGLQINTVKIDRSFVGRIGERHGSEMVRAIVALAHTLDMDVVAEGVETARAGDPAAPARMRVRPGLPLLEGGRRRRREPADRLAAVAGAWRPNPDHGRLEMDCRATAVLAVIVTLSLATAIAQTPARTPWGDPDLQGTWDFTTITPLQRPAELAGKEFLTESEAAALEKQINQQRVQTEETSPGALGGVPRPNRILASTTWAGGGNRTDDDWWGAGERLSSSIRRMVESRRSRHRRRQSRARETRRGRAATPRPICLSPNDASWGSTRVRRSCPVPTTIWSRFFRVPATW